MSEKPSTATSFDSPELVARDIEIAFATRNAGFLAMQELCRRALPFLSNAALAARSSVDAERAIRDVWPHLTGHCFEGATPECFGNMRAIVSAVVPNLPYASAPFNRPQDVFNAGLAARTVAPSLDVEKIAVGVKDALVPFLDGWSDPERAKEIIAREIRRQWEFANAK